MPEQLQHRDEGIGCISSSRVRRDGPLGLRELRAVRFDDQRQVCVSRCSETKCALKRDLPRRALDQVCAAHDVGNLLVRVIDRHRELIGEDAVAAANDHITEIAHRTGALALDAIFENDARRIIDTKAGGRRAVRDMALATRPRVTAFFELSELFTRARTLVCLSLGAQRFQRGFVGREASTLIFDRPVPVQAEGLQRAQDFVRATGNDARGIEIFDADEPTSAVMAGIEIAAHCGYEGAEV